MKTALKRALHPIRVLGGKFFIRQSDTIIWKAANITATESVEGDYLEFGVFQGASFVSAFTTIREVYSERSRASRLARLGRQKTAEQWKAMRFFAFDSFQGLPGLVSVDRRTNAFEQGLYACDMSSFLRNLRNSGVDMRKVVAVPGWFEDTCREETIKRFGMKAASIIHVDSDLWESARVVLKFVEPLLVDGTVLIFDDWYSYRGNPLLGEQRAFREWAESKTDWQFTQYQKEGPWRNSFIANRLVDNLNPAGKSGLDLLPE